MNRFSASKATATTLCQKCLKKGMLRLDLRRLPDRADETGHYSYECKASAQERPYTSRPSRTQQFHNPKLRPTIADSEQSKPKEQQKEPETRRGRKRSLDDFRDVERRRNDSRSMRSSSSSVRTISTGASRSRSPPERRHAEDHQITSRRDQQNSDRVKRRRASSSESDARQTARDENDRHRERNIRTRRRSTSPRERGRRRSSSRDREGSHRRSVSRSRSNSRKYRGQRDGRGREERNGHERSQSPYSTRLALMR